MKKKTPYDLKLCKSKFTKAIVYNYFSYKHFQVNEISAKERSLRLKVKSLTRELDFYKKWLAMCFKNHNA